MAKIRERLVHSSYGEVQPEEIDLCGLQVGKKFSARMARVFKCSQIH
jgi:hypothetical protein